MLGGIVKSRRLRSKPKFLRRTCEGDHLTHLCLAIAGIPKAWGSPKCPLYFEAFVVSPNHVPPLIDVTVIPLQSSSYHTPIVEGDVSPIHVILHHLQPRIEEVVIPVKYVVNPTPLVEGDAFFNHVISIPDPGPFEQERVLLSLSSSPPSIKEITFDWDGLVGYPMPPPMSFPVRDIIQYIIETISSISALSSLTLRDLGFPSLCWVFVRY
jgi:hypothetical protein